MRYSLRRAARALLAAGALGTTWAGAAEFCSAQPASRDGPLVGTIHVAPGQVQLEAMKVEMALLADPTTYRLPLAVHLKSDCLEIHGQVPDERSRQRCLEVARRSCYLPVHDALHVSPSAGVTGPLAGEALRQAAAETLAQNLGARAKSFDVHVSDGQISLRGQVGAVEEKLIASRCLRGLPGCTSIVNCLSVPAVNHGGHILTLVTSDGRAVIHGPYAQQETQSTGAADSPAPSHGAAQPYSLPPTPTLTLPSGLPSGRVMRPVSHDTAAEASRPATMSPAAAKPAAAVIGSSTCANCSAGMQLVVVPPSPEPTFWQRLHPHRPLLEEPARPVPAPAQLVDARPPAKAVEPGVPAAVPVPTGDGAPCHTRSACDIGPRGGAIITVPPGSTFQSRPLLLSRPLPAPTQEPPVLTAPEAPPIQTAKAQAAPAVSQGYAPERALPGLVHVSAKPAEETKPAVTQTPWTADVPPAHLVQLVQKACGKLASQVRVQSDACHQMVVHVTGSSSAQDPLIAALLSIPELSASNVKLEVHLAP
jgi:hypothetical protein